MLTRGLVVYWFQEQEKTQYRTGNTARYHKSSDHTAGNLCSLKFWAIPGAKQIVVWMCILLKSLNELMNYSLLGVLSSTRTYNPDHEVRSFLNLHPLSSVSVGSETRLVCESPYLDVFFWECLCSTASLHQICQTLFARFFLPILLILLRKVTQFLTRCVGVWPTLDSGMHCTSEHSDSEKKSRWPSHWTVDTQCAGNILERQICPVSVNVLSKKE